MANSVLKMTVTEGPLYKFVHAKGATAVDLFIYGEIGSWWEDDPITAAGFAKQLKEIDADTVNLRINSPGGSVHDGIAIFNVLDRHPAEIITHIDGIALSMGSYLAMVGDEVHMAENGMMMMHLPWTFAGGNADELREQADLLDKWGEILSVAYAKRSGKDGEEILDLLRAETWLTATEALEAGFITHIDEAMPVAACAKPSAYAGRNLPQIAQKFLESDDVRSKPQTKPPADPDAVPPLSKDQKPKPEGAKGMLNKLWNLLGLTKQDGEEDDAAVARLEALNEEFPDDADFVKAMFDAGGGVVEALRLKATVAAANETSAIEELAEAKAKAIEADAKIIGLEKQIADADERPPVNVPAGDGETDARVLHAKYVAQGMTRAAAWKLVATNHPEAHKQFRADSKSKL